MSVEGLAVLELHQHRVTLRRREQAEGELRAQLENRSFTLLCKRAGFWDGGEAYHCGSCGGVRWIGGMGFDIEAWTTFITESLRLSWLRQARKTRSVGWVIIHVTRILRCLGIVQYMPHLLLLVPGGR